ncbi:RidA family protein [Phaeobacter marinintestinus]|uniref:RidA family protein n=1 Tax=Falsiphaeobacter marinintestinus TaxID=1492905 RepID=UPI0011B8044C|nr:RidA family protein [Phaeobacter marinintestinus]
MKSLTPDTIAPPFARYAHGVEIPPTHRIVRTSGQLGVAKNGKIPEESYDQAQLCFANITQILASAGMGAGDVIHVSAYVTDRAHMEGYMRARDQFLQDRADDDLPSSTLIIVSGFTRPEFKVEIEVWAAAP